MLERVINMPLKSIRDIMAKDKLGFAAHWNILWDTHELNFEFNFKAYFYLMLFWLIHFWQSAMLILPIMLRNNSFSTYAKSSEELTFLTTLYTYASFFHTRIFPAGTKRFYNVTFRAYLPFVIYERLHNVVTTFVNERYFTYV